MKVFLSHSHTDAPLAARVSKGLEENGLEVWNPDRDLLPGDNWAAEVARALEESPATSTRAAAIFSVPGT